MEDEARESYSEEEVAVPGTFPYTITLNQDDEIAWIYGWCATPDLIEQNIENIEISFSIEGQEVPIEDLFVLDYPASADLSCKFFYTILSDWAAGEHHLNITATFTRPINDGTADYPAGDWVYDYTVYVKP
jgi:hypothetical protein